ncbi:MAG: O-antigen ligase family protein, partial [Ignavibacteria bacterium]|nr:O-antigen ligase family protein [Ignavibacteria bacterium]
VFILPKDILKYIGYSVNTISPYMTVDQNPDFIRINSTLRGPNPLGAYMIVILAVVVSYFCKFKLKIDDKLKYLLTSLLLGGLVVLWFTYSRSAIVAAIVSIVLVVLVSFSGKILSKKLPLVIITATLAIFAGLIFAFNNNYLISNVLLHQNPNDDTSVNSNDNHLSSIQTGLTLALIQPFGAGVGSTGSASLFGSSPIIIENQYLFIAHEAGWLGLVLFIGIFGLLMFRLWQNRKNWLALGVFASGVGLALVGLLLPVWVDDTVAIVWWGLAAIALIKQK